ncbi:hypothetical protein CHARACLAT_013850 [Characodon lateralis]|uniref:Uncharacterized protein n=1 Tax=Characodon lateralis TaxID=208331 RepID=A0ABU7EW02_9TELE|nr:hypothetical protein [Characodon lateralis]
MESALPHCPRLITISSLAARPTRISDGLPGNFAPCTFHKLLINSSNVSLFECSLHVGQIGLKNDDRKCPRPISEQPFVYVTYSTNLTSLSPATKEAPKQ